MLHAMTERPPIPAIEFEELVQELLRANGYQLGHRPSTHTSVRRGFDFSANLADRNWAVEVKFYRTKRAQPSLLENAARGLAQSAQSAGFKRGMLVVSCFIETDLRLTLEERHGLLFVDRVDLANWANQAPHLVDRLAALIDEAPDGSAARGRVDNTTISLATLRYQLGPAPQEGDVLCRKLRSLGKGRKHWLDYEALCAEILRFLFPDDLHGWHKQKRTDDGLNRYDLVCRVSRSTQFWSFVADHLSSRYVVFEFKNYVGKVKQGQVLTTEKYLLPQALRRLGILLTRKGADPGAEQTIRGAMRDVGKMMLVLDDDDVCELLHAKDRGEDPSDFLFQMTDDFLMQLNR